MKNDELTKIDKFYTIARVNYFFSKSFTLCQHIKYSVKNIYIVH